MASSRMLRLGWWSAVLAAGWLAFHPAATLVTRAASLSFIALLQTSVLLNEHGWKIAPKRHDGQFAPRQ
jgi:hypothetical protein